MTNRWEERMKIRHLKAVLAIHECKSVTAAAGRLCISPAAISKSIAEMEDVLGVDIFVRDGRSVKPSEAGERVIASAQRIFREVKVLGDEIDLLSRGHHGKIKVGMQAVSTQLFTARVIARVKKAYPSLSIRLEEGVLPDVLRGVRAGQYDLAIGRLVPSLLQPDLAGLPIIWEPDVLVASAGHPVLHHRGLDWRHLIDHCCFALSLPGTPMRNHFDAFLAESSLPQPRSIIEANSTVMTRNLLQIMPVIAILPASMARSLEEEAVVAILPLPASAVPHPIGLIWSEALPLASAAQIFRDAVSALVEQDAAT